MTGTCLKKKRATALHTGAGLPRHLLTEALPAYPGTQISCPVESNTSREFFLQKCEERNDVFPVGGGGGVKACLLSVSDLVAPKTRYHRKCHATFSKPNPSKRSIGRPMEDRVSFLKMCNYIEQSDECQYSIHKVQDIMSGISGKKETYSDKRLKNHLLEHFKERITVSNVFGTKNVMHRDSNLETEKLKIVLAASDIKEDIQKVAYGHNTYPDTKDMKSGGENLIPNTLASFNQKVTENKNTSELGKLKRKCVRMNHAIISAVGPRSFLSLLQIGLAFTLHHLYGSKHLINM
ncbi:hypothetical protein PR048_015225 [Dryococelus australis]|uniref:Uncharacterized protein n=1 Tax=Dryococelus australis TaxID=614101 RepID=A0ABQ9HGC8_9NEOP|nr:hypothetical protein PR048_015225 [Dryococelus australis]